VAIVHAIIIGLVVMAGHAKPAPRPQQPTFQVPYAQPQIGADVKTYAPLQRPAHVNLDAQNEMKQAGPCSTGNCPQYQIGRPAYINGERVVRWGPVVQSQQQPASLPAAKPATAPPAAMPSLMPPATVPPIRNVDNRPSAKKFQLILFLDESVESQKLIEWFRSDRTLAKARLGSDFQYYMPDNPLYKTRFADMIPVSQFPVVLLQDQDGGHIHAAGGNMIPGTPAELWSDMQQGYKLYLEANAGGMQSTGAIKTRAYNWDSMITPAMQLAPEDCPDGNCPLPNNEPGWRPGDLFRPDSGSGGSGGFFDGSLVPKSLFVWSNSQEIMTAGVLIIGALLLFYILTKRGK